MAFSVSSPSSRNGGVVLADRIVEGQLGVLKSHGGASAGLVAHLLGQFHQLGDDLGRRQCPVGVAVDGVVQQSREKAALDDVRPPQRPDAVVEQAPEDGHLEVGALALCQAFQELVGDDREVGALHAGGGVDVDELVGGDGLGHELADRRVKLGGTPAPTAPGLPLGFELEDGGTDVGEEPDVVADGQRFVTGPGQGERLQQREHLGQPLRRRHELLAGDGQVVAPAPVGGDELGRLHEHPA